MAARALTLLLLVLALASPAAAQVVTAGGAGQYRVIVTEVDSSEFPKVKLKFKVLIQQAGVGPWDPSKGLTISEEVKYRKQGQDVASQLEGKDVKIDEEPCEIKPVALGVAVDVSGSVTSVMREISAGTSQVFQQMHQENLTHPDQQDVGALYAFSTERQDRFPLPQGQGIPQNAIQGSNVTAFQPGSGPAAGAGLGAQGAVPGQAGGIPAGAIASGGKTYIGGNGLQELSRLAQYIPSGGGSPIWNGMKNEAELLSRHDPQNSELQRVLVTFTDGQDNQSGMEDVNRLLFLAQQAGITLVNLGYGKTNDFGLDLVAKQSGGVYVSGVEGNIAQILTSILDGMRKTWCAEYTSPHPHLVNEPALVRVSTGGDEGVGVFPLPYLIPEDTKNVRLFVPVTEFTYQNLVAKQNANQLAGSGPSQIPIFVDATAKLLDKDGDPWEPLNSETGGKGPDRKVKELSFAATEWSKGEKGKPLSGWGLWMAANSEEWDDMFKVPTDTLELVDSPEELEKDGRSQIIDGVSHWIIEAKLEQDQSTNTATSVAKRNLPIKIRVSVQDRTPPNLLVRARPQDGGPPMEARVLPMATDQDTGIMAYSGNGIQTLLGSTLQDFSRPTYEKATEPGQGAKKARFAYTWRDLQGGRVDGFVDEVYWSLYDQDRKATFRGQTQDGSEAVAVAGTEHKVTENGLLVPAGVRMMLQIASRDNYALAELSGVAADAAMFTEPETEGGPAHARFDLGSEEATPFDEQAPYIPFMKREDQEKPENKYKPGLTWWIESSDARDRYADIEGLTEIHYQVPDDGMRIEAASDVIDAEPTRWLKIRSKDGNGNFTCLELPIRVVPSGFKAKTIDWRSRRLGPATD